MVEALVILIHRVGFDEAGILRVILLLALQQQVFNVAILLGFLGHRDRRSVKQRSGLAATCWHGSLVKLHRRLLLGAAQELVNIGFVCPREAKLS